MTTENEIAAVTTRLVDLFGEQRAAEIIDSVSNSSGLDAEQAWALATILAPRTPPADVEATYAIACPECGAPYDTAAIRADGANSAGPWGDRTLVLGCSRCVVTASMPMPPTVYLLDSTDALPSNG